MSRYIDADALGIGKANRDVFEKPEYADGWNSAIDVIDNAPTVDAVEVVHAYWDDTGRYRFKDGSIAVRCSNCGCSITEKEYQKFVWNGCPVCLAKMDGERRNDVEQG